MLARFLTTAAWVSTAMLLGRVSGLVRELFIAANLGATSFADVCVLLLLLPDLVVSILAGAANGGAMSQVLIPEAKRLGEQRAFRLFRGIFMGCTGISVAGAALLSLGAAQVVDLLAPGFDPATRELAISMCRIVVWAIPFVMAASVMAIYLQSRERFLSVSFSTLANNLILIAALVYAGAGANALPLLMKAMIVAAAGRLLLQALELVRIIPGKAGAGGAETPRSALGWKYLQATAASSLLLVLPTLCRRLMSLQGEGAVALIGYATRIVDLPVMLLSILSFLIFPRVSELFAAKSTQHNAAHLSRESLRVLLLLSACATAGLIWLVSRFESIPPGWGKISELDVSTLRAFILAALVGLPAQALSGLTLSLLNANRDTRSPMLINAVAAIAYYPFGVALSVWFGATGPILALAASYTIIVTLQLIVLERRYDVGCRDLFVGVESLRTWLISAAVFAAFFAIARILPDSLAVSFTLAVLAAGLAFVSGLMSLERYRRSFSRLLKPGRVP